MKLELKTGCHNKNHKIGSRFYSTKRRGGAEIKSLEPYRPGQRAACRRFPGHGKSR